ncbi:MAG: hypothetical protein KDB73_17320, partial [Planctomycetes bacterium]|nr:hypothetical protein [Planctomycetota bacterium]
SDAAGSPRPYTCVMQRAGPGVLAPGGYSQLRPYCSVADDGHFFLGYFADPGDVEVTVRRDWTFADAVLTPGRPTYDIRLDR